MTFDLINFFTPSRLFSLRASTSTETLYFLLGLFGLMIVLGLLIKGGRLVIKSNRLTSELLNKYFILLTTHGAIGLLLLAFRYERAYILSARFWMLLWLIGFIAHLVYVLKYQFKTVPALRQKTEQRKVFNQYLPSKK